MFKDSMIGVSNLSFSLFASLKDMVQRNTFETVVSDQVQFVNDKGDIYIPYTKKYSAFRDGDNSFPKFIPGGHNGENPRMRDMIYFQDFKAEYIDPNITTISYNKAISISSMLKQLSAEPKVYGVVLQYARGRGKAHGSINPMHPMVAFLIMAGLLELPEEGKLHIFEYKDSMVSRTSEFNATQKKEIDGYKTDYEKFFAIAGDIHKEPVKIKQHSTISDSTISAVIDDPFIENINATVEIFKDTSGAGQTRDIKSLIVPNQLVMDGTASPYYGIANIIDPTHDNIKGVGLGPMVTGNISLHRNDGSDTTYPEFQRTANDHNVCTGSENSVIPRGWFTLSKVNLSSMYFSDVIDRDKVFPFIQASKDLSLDIWSAYEDQKNSKVEEALEETAEV